jgi:lipid A 3-O-deacylase
MIRKIAIAAAACMFAAAAHGVDGIAVEVGRGDEKTNAVRVAALWQWTKEWPAGGNWRLGGYWEASAGAWENHDDSTTDLALTPVFRFQHRGEEPLYLEAAIGFHILSKHISSARQFSTNFQFGDHLGAGARFGSRRQFDLGVRLQHISNGSIREPNPGINFVLLRFQYVLD